MVSTSTTSFRLCIATRQYFLLRDGFCVSTLLPSKSIHSTHCCLCNSIVSSRSMYSSTHARVIATLGSTAATGAAQSRHRLPRVGGWVNRYKTHLNRNAKHMFLAKHWFCVSSLQSQYTALTAVFATQLSPVSECTALPMQLSYRLHAVHWLL